MLMEAEGLAQEPPGAVSIDGTADGTGSDNPKARTGVRGQFLPVQDDGTVGKPISAFFQGTKIPTIPDSPGPRKREARPRSHAGAGIRLE